MENPGFALKEKSALNQNLHHKNKDSFYKTKQQNIFRKSINGTKGLKIGQKLNKNNKLLK